MIKAVIFDCFGVLVTDAWAALVEEVRQADPEKAEQLLQLAASADRGLIKPDHSRAASAAILGLSVEEYRHRVRSGEARNTALFDYILTLRPHYKTAIMSNILKSGLQSRFTEEELATYFDTVVASGDVGYAKPEAQIYEITADRLGVRLDECVFIDDREAYCDGARAVGMQAIHYRSFDQLQTELQQLLV